MFDFLKELGPAIRREVEAYNNPERTNEYTKKNEGSSTEFDEEYDANGEAVFDENSADVIVSKEVKEKKLLSKSTRVVIIIMGLIFLVSQWTTVASMSRVNLEVIQKALIYCKAIFLSADVIATLICLRLKGRKAEIFAIIGVAVFIIVQFASTTLLMGL